MSESVDLPAVGRVKTTYLVGAGALVAGIVGYAWWRARSEPAAEIVPGDDFGDDYASESVGARGGGPTSGYGGGSTEVGPEVPMPPRTNDEWSRRVIETMGDYGYEPALVSSAVGKYLARKPLTSQEADLINQARAIMGPPPIGEYPVTLVPATPAPTVPPKTPTPVKAPPKPGAVGGLRVAARSAASISLAWRPASGATYYQIYMDGRSGFVTSRTPAATVRNLWARRRYTFRVRGVNAAGVGGPLAVVSGTTS